MTDRVRVDTVFEWGEVTQSAPLRVKLDSSDSPLAETPVKLVTGLPVGLRVFCAVTPGGVIVLGKPL